MFVVFLKYFFLRCTRKSASDIHYQNLFLFAVAQHGEMSGVVNHTKHCFSAGPLNFDSGSECNLKAEGAKSVGQC